MEKGNDLNKAAKLLKEGKIVCFPTETVFGLGVISSSFDAYTNLNKVKGRPEDKPYTMMVSNINEIEKYAYLSERDKKIINKFMPGQITVLLNAKENVKGFVTHNTNIIGIRIPDYPMLIKLIELVGEPLLVPSANKSGDMPAIMLEEAISIFNDEVSYYLEGRVKIKVPSTVIDLTKEEVKIIREGSITLKEINEVLEGK